MNTPRFWVILLLLLGAVGLVRLRGDVDRVPTSRPLNEFPASLDGMTSTDIPLNADVLEILGKGVFLNRVYVPAAGEPGANLAPVGLFIGYFPTQRTGQSIHSPQNCLPGAGWTFESKGVTTLTDAGGKSYQVGEYTISNGKIRQEVLYWYRSHGRSIASDYMAKLYTLADSIRYNRTDAALVRVITPVQPNETQHQAHDRAVGFAEKMAPLLPPYIPD